MKRKWAYYAHSMWLQHDIVNSSFNISQTFRLSLLKWQCPNLITRGWLQIHNILGSWDKTDYLSLWIKVMSLAKHADGSRMSRRLLDGSTQTREVRTNRRVVGSIFGLSISIWRRACHATTSGNAYEINCTFKISNRALYSTRMTKEANIESGNMHTQLLPQVLF